MELTPDQFAAELARVAAGVAGEVVNVVRKGAQNVKRDARASVNRTAPIHNAHAQYAITYDDPKAGVAFGGAVISAEVGYDKDINGGPLGNLLEFGGGGDHSPPHRDLGRALDAEEPRLEAALADVGDRLLK